MTVGNITYVKAPRTRHWLLNELVCEHRAGEHADYIVTECEVCVSEAQSLGMEVPQ